jgi:hypothetical protein
MPQEQLAKEKHAVHRAGEEKAALLEMTNKLTEDLRQNKGLHVCYLSRMLTHGVC